MTGPPRADGRRAVFAALGPLRIVTGLVVIALALLGEDPDHATIAVLAVTGLVHLAVSARWAWTRVPEPDAPLLVAVLATDLAFFLAQASASGGADSPVLLLVVVLPMFGAFALGPRCLAATGLVGALLAAVVLDFRNAEDAAVFYAQGTFGTVVGVVAAHGRMVLRRRLLGLEAMGAAMVAPRAARADGTDDVGGSVAAELRRTALLPVAEVRDHLARRRDGELTGLAEDVAAIGARVRALVQELHLLGGRAGRPRDVLATVARRRAPDAVVEVELDPAIDPAAVPVVVDAARDAIDLVAGPPTRTLAVTAWATGSGVRLEVTARPDAGLPEREAARRGAVLRARLDREGADLDRVPTPGDARVAIRLHGLTDGGDATPRLRARRFRETGRLIATIRFGLATTLLVLVALVGGLESGGGWAVAATVAWLVGFGVHLRVPRPVAAYVVAYAGDTVLLSVCFALAGDTQSSLIPLAPVVPASAAAVFSPSAAVGLVVLAAAILPLLGDVPQPEVTVAFVAVAALAAAEASIARRVSARLTTERTARGRVLGALVTARDEERRRLAAALHDDALQLLLAARQDLEEAEAGQAGAREAAGRTLDRAVDRLAGLVTGLGVDEGAAAVEGGLAPALMEAASVRRGPPAFVAVDPRAEGIDDALVVRLVREFATNVARHAGAGRVEVEVTRTAAFLTIDVADDGCGLDRDRVRDAVRHGHIGLAAARERIERRGGALDLLDAPGGGTHVHVRVPVDGQSPGSSER